MEDTKNKKKIKKYWIISFWLLFGLCVAEAFVDAWFIGISGISYSFGRLFGLAILFGAPYWCGYKNNGVHSLIYLMTVITLSMSFELIDIGSQTIVDIILMLLKGSLWFSTYKLLLLNASSRYHIKQKMASCVE